MPNPTTKETTDCSQDKGTKRDRCCCLHRLTLHRLTATQRRHVATPLLMPACLRRHRLTATQRRRRHVTTRRQQQLLPSGTDNNCYCYTAAPIGRGGG